MRFGYNIRLLKRLIVIRIIKIRLMAYLRPPHGVIFKYEIFDEDRFPKQD